MKTARPAPAVAGARGVAPADGLPREAHLHGAGVDHEIHGEGIR